MLESTSAISALVAQLPVYLAWFAGIVAAVINWRKHPRVSLIVVIVVLVFFFESVTATMLNFWLPMNLPAETVGTVFFVKGVIQSVLNAVLWALMFVAMFGWRGKRANA